MPMMTKRSARWTIGSVVLVLILAAPLFLWATGFFDYSTSSAREAADQLDQVTVSSSQYMGEIEGIRSLARYYKGSVSASPALVRHGERQLGVEYGSGSPFENGKVREMGWLSIDDCRLTAFEVKEPSRDEVVELEISEEDLASLKDGKLSIIKLQMMCDYVG